MATVTLFTSAPLVHTPANVEVELNPNAADIQRKWKSHHGYESPVALVRQAQQLREGR